ncbi:MAG: LPS export ABC transporter periplasmic protein LptC [Brevinematia bacterium]
MRLFLILCFFIFTNLCFGGSFRPAGGKPVEIKAGRAVYKWDIKKLLLENSNNVQPRVNYEKSVLIASLMIYDDNSKKGFAFGNVYYEDKKENVVVTSDEAVYDETQKEITLTRNPKIFYKKDGTFARGDKIKIYPEKDRVFLLGRVKITNTNITITGDNAELNNENKTFFIRKDVVVAQEGSKLYAEKFFLDGKVKNKENYVATGNVRIVDEKEGYSIYGNRLDYFKEFGYTRITGAYSNIYSRPTLNFEKKDIDASSIVMEKFDNEDKANLLGNVVVRQGTKKARGMWGEYFIKKKKAVLTGNPVLEDGGSKFYSYKINVDIEKETMSMVGKGKGTYFFENQ